MGWEYGRVERGGGGGAENNSFCLKCFLGRRGLAGRKELILPKMVSGRREGLGRGRVDGGAERTSFCLISFQDDVFNLCPLTHGKQGDTHFAPNGMF